jgi:hypothetical protein
LTPPNPQLKGAWFQPLNLSSENPVSKCAFQIQPAPLHHGDDQGGAVQVESSLPVACKRLVSTLEHMK